MDAGSAGPECGRGSKQGRWVVDSTTPSSTTGDYRVNLVLSQTGNASTQSGARKWLRHSERGLPTPAANSCCATPCGQNCPTRHCSQPYCRKQRCYHGSCRPMALAVTTAGTSIASEPSTGLHACSAILFHDYHHTMTIQRIPAIHADRSLGKWGTRLLAVGC